MTLSLANLAPGIGGGTTEPSRDGDGHIIGIGVQFTDDTGDLDSCTGFLKVALHELGHAQNLDDTNGSGGSSVMNQMSGKNDSGGNIPTDVTPCDTTVVEVESQVRRDDDFDGYSPDDDPMDCDGTTSGDPGDDNAEVYPGAEDTSPVCVAFAQQQELPDGYDFNCDGIDDREQIGVVCPSSPIVIDTGGNGFSLTDRANGVLFDLDSDRRAERIPWTSPSGDDAWLVLDRNSNGRIDNGRELFGNYTPQPPAVHKNGFLALAVYDHNGDGWIDSADPIFADLCLWNDRDHDGVSAAGELKRLADVGIRRLSLDYRESLRRDEHGNWFRFGAKVVDGRNRDVGPMAFDVFFDDPAGRLPPSPQRDQTQRRIGPKKR